MIFNKLISIDYNAILITVIVIAVLLFAIYFTIIILSFIFMKSFKNKLKKGRRSINLILFQKNDCLLKLGELYKDKLNDNSPIKRYLNNPQYRKFVEIKVDEFDDFYNFSEKILNLEQKAYVLYGAGDNESYVKEIFSALSELNNKYLQAIQLYNTNVIGYNYRRNFFSTKRIKNLLFIKNINTIK